METVEPKSRRLILPKELKAKKGIPFRLHTLREHWRAGLFPKPIHISPGGRKLAFFEDEIDAWLEARAKAERAA